MTLLQHFVLHLSSTVSHDELKITDDSVNSNKRTLLSCGRLLSVKREIIDFPLCADWDDSRQSEQRHRHAGKYGKPLIFLKQKNSVYLLICSVSLTRNPFSLSDIKKCLAGVRYGVTSSQMWEALQCQQSELGLGMCFIAQRSASLSLADFVFTTSVQKKHIASLPTCR